MTDFAKALTAFWSSFDMPAYQTEQVPNGTAFPYVTFEVLQGAPFSQNVLTARAWFRAERGQSVNAQVAQFLDNVKKAIPPQGVTLQSGDGFFSIFPNGAGFLSWEVDPASDEAQKIISGRVSYQINYYA